MSEPVQSIIGWVPGGKCRNPLKILYIKWNLVVRGWWLVVGGWWLVVRGSWFVVVVFYVPTVLTF